MDRIIAAEVFVAIVECGSLIRAAHALDMSRAMVTRYLAQMEYWADARLLHRTTRKLSLTAAGETTLAHCRTILAVAAQMPLGADSEADAPHGMLRITCSQPLGQSILASAVAQYLRRYPRTAIDLQISGKAVNLVEERIDLAIRITNSLDPNLIARPLANCASVVCASPAYIALHGSPQAAEDLTRHNCLTYSYFGKSLWEFQYNDAPLSIPVSGNLTANESVVLLHATLQGVGISMQPLFMAAPLIASGQLVNLLPCYQPQAMGIHAVYSSRQHMPATLRTMLDFLVEWFQSKDNWTG